MTDDRREFHRPARVFPAPVDRDDVTVPRPPVLTPPTAGGILAVLVPVLGSLGMFGFALMSGERRHLVLAGLIAVGILASGFAARALHNRQQRANRRRTTERYVDTIDEIRRRLDEGAMRQRRWNDSSYPAAADLWSVVADRSRVWERRPGHSDFLIVRIGTGDGVPAVRPTLEKVVDPLAEHDPELLERAERLVADHTTVPAAPTIVDLGPTGCLAIAGDLATGRSVARGIALQLAVFRAPDDLRITVATSGAEPVDWSWAQRLPHVGVDGRIGLITTATDLDEMLDSMVTPRLEHLEAAARTSNARARFPREVVIVDGYDPDSAIGRLERLDDALARASSIDVTFICVVASPALVPSTAENTLIVERSGARLTGGDGRAIDTTPATAPLDLCAQIARVLQPLSLRTRTGRATSFDSPGLMRLLDIDETASVTTGATWLPHETPLRAPIGVGEDGQPIVLDLTEASSGGMGPHGMLIGATGSGKSELLRTLVLSLASQHHPDDLAFVLIDFKGGATFGSLDRLPHSAGLITNLEADPAMVDRMMEALRGEMERRQRVLHDAGGFDRADEYRAHRRAHPELDPLPALVVVVDEFGELINTKPQFGELFAMIGRLGRSLGVHLLLSTQRLEDAGLRRLEGHLRYRLALRTFTPEESNAVIGSRAAAELPPIPGVGYLKVDGALTAFKAGIVSRPPRAGEGTEMEQLVAAWQSAGVSPTRAVWLPPLPEAIGLAGLPSVESDGGLRIPVGVEDLPARQEIRRYDIDLAGRSGHLAVVGAPRTGKSTFLQTFVLSAASAHHPDDLQIYAVDLGGGGLALLEDLPHVGAVLGRSHQAEIGKLIRRMETLIEERAERYRTHRITTASAYHQLRRSGAFHDELGEVVLVVDNWGALTQELSHEQYDSLTGIITGGLHHGIHVVMTANRWHDLKPALRDVVGGRFELRLADAIDSEIDRTAARSIAEAGPGRGIGPGPAQVQVALPRLDDGAARIPAGAAIEQAVTEVTARWDGAIGAPPIRVLPEVVPVSALVASVPGAVVLGVEEHRLGPWTIDLFGADPHLVVLGDSESGRTNLLRRLVGGLGEAYTPAEVQIAVVDYRRRLAGSTPDAHTFAVATSPESAAVLASKVSTELATRFDSEPGTRPRIVLVIDDYDLVAGTTGNPLSPLTDRIAQGRDLGFHVVLARRVGGITRSSFEPMLQRIREIGTPGVVLTGDPQEGPVVGSVRAMPGPPGRGRWVWRNKVVEVQAALCPEPMRQVVTRLEEAQA